MTTEFHGTIRRWREDKPGGLAVVDVPTELVAGGGFCVGVSKAAMKAAAVSVGDEVILGHRTGLRTSPQRCVV